VGAVSIRLLVDSALRALKGAGASERTLKVYECTGFGELCRRFEARGAREYSPELADVVVSEVWTDFERGALSSWKWTAVRRGAALLDVFDRTGSVALAPLPPWNVLRLPPTPGQRADQGNLHVLVWTAQERLQELGVSAKTLQHYRYDGFDPIVPTRPKTIGSPSATATLAIPEDLRVYALGDMDARDWPLRVLATPVDAHLDADPDEEAVTAEVLATAVEYFRDRNLAIAAWQTRTPADGAERAQAATLTIYRGRQEHPGTGVLQNGWPAAITINRRDYSSVTHAYWALSTSDPGWHDRIAAAPKGDDATTLAEEAPRRAGWPAARPAVMAALLRAKYVQHPNGADLARHRRRSNHLRRPRLRLLGRQQGTRHQLDRSAAGSHSIRTRRRGSGRASARDS